MVSEYRLSPRLAARFLGAGLVGLGTLVCIVTVLIAVLQLPLVTLAVVALVALVAIGVAGWLLTSGGYVVRLTDQGYRVRLVRGAGVKQARWKDVDDAVAVDVAGAPCLVLRLHDGATTTIPVEMVAGSSDAFVKDVQEHLQAGHGLRRIS